MAARRWLFLGGYLGGAGVLRAVLLGFRAPLVVRRLRHRRQTTLSIWRARVWIPYLSVPVGLGLLCLQMLTQILLVLTHRTLPFNLRPEESL